MGLWKRVHDFVRPTLSFYDYYEEKKVAEFRVWKNIFDIVWSSGDASRYAPERLLMKSTEFLKLLIPYKMFLKLRKMSPDTSLWAIVASRVTAVSVQTYSYIDEDTGVKVEFL